MNIKCVDDIKNGWLVITRDKKRYIKIDKYLIGEEGHLCVSDYQIKGGLILDIDQFEQFDIIEIWSPADVLEFLSFDLEDRELVWKEQEQKYYITHRWLDIGGFGFVNWDKENDYMQLHDISCSDDYDNYQTRFTKKEIEEIKEKYNTTLEDFKIIPVKEI